MNKKLILNFIVPALSNNHYIFQSFKVMARKKNVRSSVNAGFLFRMQSTNNYIVEEQPKIVFGHISPNFILRVDMTEDLGESLNPLLDIGQMEGAFTMGMGYFYCERIAFDENSGALKTNRTWNYWSPGPKDIPVDFRVTIKKNATNPTGVLRSKATGEPSLCTSFSLVNALRFALQSARKDAGLPDEWFNFDPPCTFENTCLSAASSVENFLIYEYPKEGDLNED